MGLNRANWCLDQLNGLDRKRKDESDPKGRRVWSKDLQEHFDTMYILKSTVHLSGIYKLKARVLFNH